MRVARPVKRFGIVGLAGLVAVAAVGLVTPSATAAPALVSTRFAAVPSHVASASSPVELRLAVTNRGSSPTSLTVRFKAHTPFGVASAGADVVLWLAASQQSLARAWVEQPEAGTTAYSYEVRSGSTTVSSGSWPIQVVGVAGAPRGYPAFWVEPGHVLSDPSVGSSDVDRLVDEIHGLGGKTIVVAYVEYEWNNSWGPFYPSSIPELGEPSVDFDLVGTLLHRASQRGMTVYLGLGRGPNGPLNFDNQPAAPQSEMDAAAAFGTRVARELWSLYGHEPSLYGWYLSQEANDFNSARRYYEPQARQLHEISAEMPVMVAPAGTPFGIAGGLLDSTDVQVFAYQDAVGPGYVGPDTRCATCVPYTYTYEPYNRIADLDRIYRTYASWHVGTKSHIWADSEVWQMSGPTYGFPFAAPCARLADQLSALSPHVSQISAYEYFGYMKSPSDDTNMQMLWADQLHDGYAAFASKATSTVCPGGDTRMHKCALTSTIVAQLTARCRPV